MNNLLLILLAFTLHYDATLTTTASTGSCAPYWLQTNRDGLIANTPNSGTFSLGICHPAEHPNRWYDMDFAFTAVAGLQETRSYNRETKHLGRVFTNLAYWHGRLLCFDLTAGVKPLSYGPPDDSLSTGGLLFSRNALPMPRITLGIDHYYGIPGCKDYLQIRGGISHFWQGSGGDVHNSYIHHKFVGARVGGRWPVNLTYEFHHAAQWGGTSDVYGDLGKSFTGFKNAFLARQGGSMDVDQLNAQGNHLCSQYLQLDAKGKQWKASAYWQILLEDKPIRIIGNTMNNRDGLWGLHVEQTAWPYISGLTYEYLQTSDQSGPFHDRDGYIYGGQDAYYQNFVFNNGWNYRLRGIGNPMLTSPIYNTDGSSQTQNSRVEAHFLGLKGDIYSYRWRALVSYARNYGNDYVTRTPLSHNTAWLLEVSHRYPRLWNLDLTLSLAGDHGNQFGNHVGLMMSIHKQF